jgi:hypothetical protein
MDDPNMVPAWFPHGSRNLDPQAPSWFPEPCSSRREHGPEPGGASNGRRVVMVPGNRVGP